MELNKLVGAHWHRLGGTPYLSNISTERQALPGGAESRPGLAAGSGRGSSVRAGLPPWPAQLVSWATRGPVEEGRVSSLGQAPALHTLGVTQLCESCRTLLPVHY